MADPLFVDTLDIWLAVLAWGLLTAAAWVTYRFVMGRGQQADRSFGYAFFAIGVYALVMGLWGSMTWPLPSSYNIVLMDPYALYGVALLMLGLALITGVDLKGPTIAIAFLSVSVLIYAADIAKYHLTNSPAAAAALFVLVGLSGILGPFLNLGKSSRYVAYLEVILLVLAALLSAYIGGMATFEHTADWAKWVPFYG
ncbi:DUF981 family protein [Acidilobus sp.]|uniref:DUF981 family protein n=1 Tax=Acidilobus sp. TaxID=1872109 RepID=UPI003D037CF9